MKTIRNIPVLFLLRVVAPGLNDPEKTISYP